jgi:hypothetical protein
MLSGAVGAGNEDVVWLCGQNVGSAAGLNVHDPQGPTAVPADPAAAATTVPNKYLPANCRP